MLVNVSVAVFACGGLSEFIFTRTNAQIVSYASGNARFGQTVIAEAPKSCALVFKPVPAQAPDSFAPPNIWNKGVEPPMNKEAFLSEATVMETFTFPWFSTKKPVSPPVTFEDSFDKSVMEPAAGGVTGMNENALLFLALAV